MLLSKRLHEVSHRVSRAGLHVSFSLGFHCKLSVQNLLHWHFLIKAAAGLHLIITLFSTPLSLFLHRCTDKKNFIINNNHIIHKHCSNGLHKSLMKVSFICVAHLLSSCPWPDTSDSGSTGSGSAGACLSGNPYCLDTCT